MSDLDYKLLLYRELRELQQEHKELDEIIIDPESIKNFSNFTLSKFKKRKLLLKDKIDNIKKFLSRDIIA